MRRRLSKYRLWRLRLSTCHMRMTINTCQHHYRLVDPCRQSLNRNPNRLRWSSRRHSKARKEGCHLVQRLAMHQDHGWTPSTNQALPVHLPCTQMSSQRELRRKHIRSASGDTNPDFDAAFDAAVEAAYDEGLEPDLEGRSKPEMAYKKHVQQESIVCQAQRLRRYSRLPISTIRITRWLQIQKTKEEERLLDDITQDYAQTFNFDTSSKSALPRQSDSSGYSRSTWQSSQVSDRTTAGTSLSTVAEDAIPGSIVNSKNAFAASASLNSVLADPPPPSAPPPQTSLPKLPIASQNRMSGIRSRRLSGQNQKQLKIETSAAPEIRKRASHTPP